MFVVFQRALGGNAPLFHTQTQSDTYAFTHKRAPGELVNGTEGIKQHDPLCITGCISVALALKDPSAALAPLCSCLHSRIT